MEHVFISYIHENTEDVDRLYQELISHGIKVWLDRNDIKPGSRWKDAVRKAIREGTFFIACFSKEYNKRNDTYMNEELTIAIEELRQRPTDRVWFIPVQLNKCKIPDRNIGGGETLNDLQHVKLYQNWDVGIQRILKVIQPESPDPTINSNASETDKPLKGFITYSHEDTEAKNELRKRLAVMEQQNELVTWDDGQLTPGDGALQENILKKVEDSDLLLYLVSAASLASKNCNRELAEALKKEIRVIPIILEHCDWFNHQLSRFEVLPDKGKAINEWEPATKGWQNVVAGIWKVINKMRSETDSFSGTSEEKLRAELALQRGVCLMLLSLEDPAIEALSDAIKFDPDHVFAYTLRSEIYRMKDNFDLAINDYNRAIQLDPDDVSLYNNRGICYHNKNDYDHAIADFNMAIKLKPNYVEAYNGRGLVYTDKGDFDHAIADFNTAIELNPYDVDKGQVDQASTNFNTEAKLSPDFAKAYYTKCYWTFLYNRGRAYAIKGELDVAIDDFSMAIDLNPNYAAAFKARSHLLAAMGIDLNPSYVEAYFNRGVAHWDKGEVDIAIEDFNMVIKLNPDYAKAYFNLGVAYERKDEVDLAIDNYNMVIALDPNFPEVYHNRGTSYLLAGDFDNAITDYNKAIELNPDCAETYNNRGNTYRFMSDFDNAITDYNKAIELNPNFPKAYYNRGNTYYSKGEHDKAIDDCSKAIEFDPMDAKAYFNRGIAYDSKDEVDLAIKDYNTAIELKPDYAMVYRYRGVAHWIKGEDDLPIQDFSTAIEIDPEDSESYCYRGIFRLFSQNWQEVKTDLTIAKDLGMDIIALFDSLCSGVAEFEEKVGVQLPPDIAEMLTQQ